MQVKWQALTLITLRPEIDWYFLLNSRTDKEQSDIDIVFIDDAHTFGGTQIALAWTIRILLLETGMSVLCVCTRRTRSAIVAIVGDHARLYFEDAPPALPLNLFAFPLRLPAYIALLRRVRAAGVRSWCLNLPDIEFGLAPLIVLHWLGETTCAMLHGTARFISFYRDAPWYRKLLSAVRDAVSNRLVYRLHDRLIVPSRSSQAEVESRVVGTKKPDIEYLYLPTSAEHLKASKTPRSIPDHERTRPIQLWMIGNVVQGHKNNRAALDVLQELARRGYEAQLTLAGLGPDLSAFQVEANRRGLEDRITYLGWVSNPCLLVPMDAVVLIPSLHETMSIVAREAMQSGLRIVVSPIPIFHEWIPPSLISENFTAQAFTEKILDVMGTDGADLGETYRRALMQFSQEKFLREFLRLSQLGM